MRKKITPKEVTAYLIRDGDIIKQYLNGHKSYIIVRSHGHNFWIDDPYGNKPRITQMADEQNVSKS